MALTVASHHQRSSNHPFWSLAIHPIECSFAGQGQCSSVEKEMWVFLRHKFILSFLNLMKMDEVLRKYCRKILCFHVMLFLPYFWRIIPVRFSTKTTASFCSFFQCLTEFCRIFGLHELYLLIFPYHLCMEVWNCLILSAQKLRWHHCVSHTLQERHSPVPPTGLQPIPLISSFSPFFFFFLKKKAHEHAWEDLPAKLVEPRLIFCRYRTNRLLRRTVWWAHKKFLRIGVCVKFSRPITDIEFCRICNTIPQILPTNSHQVRTAREQFKCLHWLSLPHSLQYNSSQPDDVWTHNSSIEDVHTLWTILENYLCVSLLDSLQDRGTFVSFS